MRNLLEASQVQLALSDITGSTDSGLQLLSSCWDTASTDVLCAFAGAPEMLSISLRRVQMSGNSELEASWDAAGPVTVCDMHHFSDAGSTILVLSNGDLMKVADGAVEIVGTVDGGISAASWSPDEEVLALSTVSGCVLLMTRDLDPIHESIFSSEDLKASRHVDVGWGKAETQFQGKGAKAMSDPTVAANVDQGRPSKFEDGDVVISWRGDGAFFAVSRFDPDLRRVIRVYTREGRLDSVSEPVDGLQHALSWRPSGNIICGIREIHDQLEVIFFERNGLRHGGFLLSDEKPQKAVSLTWNSDSSILAVSFSGKTQFWTTGNYHWYLKLEYEFPVNSSVLWHPEDPNKFSRSSLVSLAVHEVSWYISGSENSEPNDWGVVSVTDGRVLKLTPLRVANVPPPMALSSIPIGFVPRHTCVSPGGDLIAALDARSISVIRWDFKKQAPATSIRRIVLKDGPHYRQIAFVDDSTICALGDCTDAHCAISILSLEDDSVQYAVLTQQVAIIGSISGRREIICHRMDGNTFSYEIDSESIKHLFKLPSFCPTIMEGIIDTELCIFSLSRTGKLYANTRLLASSVTSICVSRAYLVFITSQNMMKFVKLSSASEYLRVPEDSTAQNEQCRNVERGARIICAVPSCYSVVLQMPRGNLETVYPRAFVLDGIRKSVSVEDYKRAFLICRQHRVDLNILHDLYPGRFLSNIPLFIDQLKKSEYIDLVLSQLRDEDVTVTMYPDLDNLASNQNALSGTSPGKVNKICDSVIEYLRGNLQSAHIQNVVTAYCCKIPPDHESALTLISSLKGTREYDDAVTHICFLSDVNKLYDTALGTYELKLALTIAQRAQKDPREYLPFLQSLQEMDTLRRQFVIDDHLGRHTKALKALYDMGDTAFSELMEYVAKKLLFEDSLDLYKYDSEKLKVLTLLYAEHLVVENRHRDAGFAYEFLGNHSRAAECYRKAGLWRECLTTAQAPSNSDASAPYIHELAQSLVAELVELKDYSSAAQIYLDYLNNIAEGVRLLCRANKYSEAMRVVTTHHNWNLFADVVDPSLLEGFASTSELLADCKSQLAAQTSRILELRKKKLEDPLAYYDGISDADAPDNVSLAPTHASTSASLFTRYTGATLATALTGASRKTAKNRRKEERKRARGKKGSVYEEEYLLNSIRRLIERINSTRTETEHLIECLYRRGMRDNASGLQRQAQELTEQLCKWADAMFPKGESQEAGDGSNAPSMVGGAAPMVEAFKSLSLV